jgi:hypothetical protein
VNITKQDLLNSLSKLDVNDDAAWTDDGLPLVEAVQGLSGDDTITRKDITDNALGFDRDVARNALSARDELTHVEAQENVAASDLDEVLAHQEPEAPAPSTDEVLGMSIDERRAQLVDVVARRKQQIEDIEASMQRGRARREELVVLLDKATLALEAEFPPLRHADTVRQWLDSEAAKRAGRQGQHTFVVPASPIDESMRRSVGYGHRRVQVPSVATHG